jgi:hypothetical protein
MAPIMDKWYRFRQPRVVFDWRDILETWNYTDDTPSYVETVRFNLGWAHAQKLPLSHFLSFVNHEQDGICWLLHEIITASYYMNGKVRLDYIKGLLTEIKDLDSYFPSFRGAPNNTIREYVESELYAEELNYVEMMPPLIRICKETQKQDTTCCWASSAPAAPAQPAPAPAADFIPLPPTIVAKDPLPCDIMLRIIRTEGGRDDIIILTNNFDGTFNIVYNDTADKVASKTSFVPRDDVLKYLSNILRLLTIDAQPFMNVQLIAPNAPSVLVPVDELTSQTRDLIYDTVESVMDNWPYVA